MKVIAPFNSSLPKLDRDSFNTTVSLYALKTPPKYCQSIRKVFKSHLLNMPRTQNVAKPPGDHQSLLLLSRYVADNFPSDSLCTRGNIDTSYSNDVSKLFRLFSSCKVIDSKKKKKKQKKRKKQKNKSDDIVEMKENVDGNDDDDDNNKNNNDSFSIESFMSTLSEESFVKWDLELSYTHCSIEHVLRNILPEHLQVPTSFESIGHIAHVNLRDEHIPWKTIIGQVMIDKLSPRIRTIVNKIESTGGPYRTFAMEVLAGDHNFITSVKENNCIFHLDFANVYWNSRLETEHKRIIGLVQHNEIFVDAFCGVGPFAIPVSKKGMMKKVYANDLNPSSVKYLNENIKKNNISQDNIESNCGCAREFITKLVKEQNIAMSRVVMNFPSGAPEFLDVFQGLYNEWQRENNDLPDMPIVHCYCFIKGELETNSARKRVRTALFGDCNGGKSVLTDEAIDVKVIRDVAPKKVQVCVTFKVPKEVCVNNRNSETNGEPEKKKLKQNHQGPCVTS